MVGILVRFARRLRYPYLFALTAALFLIDLLIPDWNARAAARALA